MSSEHRRPAATAPAPEHLRHLGPVLAFYTAFARRQAAEVREVPGGAVVLNPEYSASHDHNQLLVDGEPPSAPELLKLADDALGHLGHRRITVVDDRAGAGLAAELTAAGYRHDREMAMVHDGATALPEPRAAAVEARLAEVRPAIVRQLRTWMPDAAQLEIDHLADRRTARLNGAEQVRLLAVRDGTGAVCAWADFYRDTAASIAQIEDLATADAHTRRGYGDALLSAAARLATGCETFFLLADPADWPHTWYARRGFVGIGDIHVFSRVQQPGA